MPADGTGKITGKISKVCCRKIGGNDVLPRIEKHVPLGKMVPQILWGCRRQTFIGRGRPPPIMQSQGDTVRLRRCLCPEGNGAIAVHRHNWTGLGKARGCHLPNQCQKRGNGKEPRHRSTCGNLQARYRFLGHGEVASCVAAGADRFA